VTLSTLTAAVQLSVRAALAAGLAVGVAQLLRLQFPVYALIAAVIVTDLSLSRTRRLGLRRLAGTVLGAARGAAVSSVLPPSPSVIALGILGAIFLSHLFRLHEGAKVTGYICGIVVLEHGADRWSYALHRLTETVLGIGVAVLVSLVPKLMPPHEPKRESR
jgi:uncharacterized membrane protein YgaE (UPF0421/DUF939 family)